MSAARRSFPAIPWLLTMRPAPRRWPFAVRVAASTAVIVATGWAAGDIGAALIATLGLFAADFGSRRPYLNRAMSTAVIAVALAAAVTIGVWSAPVGWIAVASVSAVAVVAVWLCSGLAVGPPGAFVFALACAAGVGVSGSHRPAWQVGLLVLAGGAAAWIAVMSPALTDWRGPEKAAVTAAGEAVAGYIEVAATADAVAARRLAATALVFAWDVLIHYQPRAIPAGRSLSRLRQANHDLHVLFTTTMAAASAGTAVPAGTAELARAIGTLDEVPALVAERNSKRPAVRHPATAARLIAAVRPDSHTRRVMLRVAVAAPLAGLGAASFGINHIYWSMAATILVLHQGDHRIATVQRGAARVIGTLAGLCVAALILSAHPTGLGMVGVLAALQFAIKMSNIRNYALATVFTTATALTIASAGHRVNIGDLLSARALDTVIGCGIGILVYLISAHLQEADRLHREVQRVMTNVVAVTNHLVHGDSSSLPARTARRDLQAAIFELVAADDAARQGSRRDRATAARFSDTVMATEHLGFATVAACWAAERGQDRLFESTDAGSYLQALRALADSAEDADHGLIAGELPPFAAPEMRELHGALNGSVPRNG